MNSTLPPLKRYGQNFLFDKNIINKIIKNAAVTRKDVILEIGPGKGSLTFELAKIAKNVLAVEIDKGLCEVLRDSCAKYENIDIYCCDILKFKLKSVILKKKIKRVKVVANVPYYITTPILEYLFKNIVFLDDIFIMVQKEVAERMSAKPGKKSYGSLSCFVNYFCFPEILFKIKSTSFYPVPKVESSLIRLKPHNNPANFHGVRSETMFFKVIRAAFGQRRKRLYGSLSKIFGKDLLLKIGCQDLLERRPEGLALTDFVKLSNVIFDFSKAQ